VDIGVGIGQSAAVRVSFSVRDDVQVDAHVDGGLPVLNEALSDSISSLRPRGAQGITPSTYWIDQAIAGALRAAESADERPFLWGNVTVLRPLGSSVVANYDDDEDDEPGDAIPLIESLALLDEWRQRVIARAAMSTTALPETYRRDPTRWRRRSNHAVDPLVTGAMRVIRASILSNTSRPRVVRWSWSERV
jgi:hypothetical protein